MKKGFLTKSFMSLFAFTVFFTAVLLVKNTSIASAADAGALDGKEAILVEDSSEDGLYYSANGGINDFRDETIYFVMTTRFYDGDSSNNTQCWDGQSKNGESDPPWRGDFKGLIQKLDYIKSLGFTAIWITPVVKNASGYDYHGYHAINFKEVDKRYESADTTYQDLIDAVHDRGMKIIQDVVFNHTGNWGEENLYPIFYRDMNADQSDPEACMVANTSMDGMADYNSITASGNQSKGTLQFLARLKTLNQDGDGDHKYDVKDIYHHNGWVGSSFEQYIVQIGSIHYADCIDLNTENPEVYKYLVDAYGQYIKMGVDAFRVDTVKHISRLTFNKAFNQQLNDIYNETHGTTGEGNFFMFGEVCTRYRSVWNSGIPAISTPFYTWKESKDYAWDDSNTSAAIATNVASVAQNYADNTSNTGEQPTSKNVYLEGNNYHTPDYSMASGMNCIDFPMHWAFKSAGEAYQQALAEDPYYNDASFNVTYVDSHDYAPDNAPENQRFAGSAETWAENLSLMFTFRGIPCIYYGSEIEFKKGCKIDEGPNIALEDSGRAYFGDHIEGSVDVIDFAYYDNATGAMKETLNYPLSLHIQRLNRLRAAIPALRKGQYSTDGCNGSFAFKRRYTDATTDSFAVVALTSDASFTGIPNGTYTDAITGDVKNVTNGSLSTSGIKGQGDLRVYVLDTALTKAPGMIEGFSAYMSGGKELTLKRVPVTSVTLDKTSAELDIADTVKLSATIAPSDATAKTLNWSSSDASVASVSQSGVVTAKNEGTATIYAAASNATKSDYDNESSKLVARATITVKASGIKVTSVTLNKTSLTMDAGGTYTLKATVLPANATAKYAKITWTSTDTKVAKVDSAGVVTAIKQGTATIKATTAMGVEASATVTVSGTVIYGNAIYFEKPAGWGSNINIYFWSKDDTWTNASWPGIAMSVVDEGNGIYGIEWPEGKDASNLNVIFNDGSNKTDDIKDVKMNGYYTTSGYQKEVETKVEPETTTESETTTIDETTSQDETTSKDETTSQKETTSKDETTSQKETTSKDETTTEKETTSKDETTSQKETTSKDETTTKEETTTEKETTTNEETTTEKETTTKEETTTEKETTTKEETTTQKELKITSFTAKTSSDVIEPGDIVNLKVVSEDGDGTVKYRFVAINQDGDTEIIKNYSKTSSVDWVPSEAGVYNVYVYAKDNSIVVKAKVKSIKVYDELVVKKFTMSKSSKKAKVGNKISLAVAAIGGSGKYKFKFAYKLGSSKAKTISGYKTKKVVSWTPKKAGTYKLRVYIKDRVTGDVISKTVKYIVKKK